MDKEAFLSQISFFEGITPENRRALAEICLPKTLKKKETLFLEGEKGYSVYILVKGHIQLYKTSPEGKEVVIKIVKPGEMFAEVILFERNRYPVSAVALKESLVFMLPKHQFSCLLERSSFRDDFIKNLMQKLHFLTDQIQYLTHYDVEDRFFLFLQEQFGKKENIHCFLSKKDIASAINATPETFSRLIQRLQKEKLITWEGKVMRIRAEAWNRLGKNLK